LTSISASNHISPKNKLATSLCGFKIPKFFIKNQKAYGTLFSAPVTQPSTLCSTPTAPTGATAFKPGTPLYFVEGLLPKASNAYNTAGNTEMGFRDE